MSVIGTATMIATGVSAAKGLLGGDKNGGAGAQQENREPWKPAQPYLLDNLEQNKKLQSFYAKNPFSDTQKQQYQGLLDVLSNNQSGGNSLLDWASNFAQSKRGVMPAMGALPKAPEMQKSPAPLVSTGMGNAFGIPWDILFGPQGTGTLQPGAKAGDINWAGMNPYNSSSFNQPADSVPKTGVEGEDAYQKYLLDQQRNRFNPNEY